MCGTRAHPEMSMSMTLYFLPPPGSLLALGALSDTVRSREVTENM